MGNFLELLFSFTRVGIFGFGGGPSFIPLIQEEVVDRHGWLTHEEFVDALAMGNSLPGPIGTKLSTYVGYKIAGIPGVIAGLIGTVLPSVILMLALTTMFWQFKDSTVVQSMLRGIRPAIIAMMAFVVVELFRPGIKSYTEGIIALACLAIMLLFNIHPAIITVIGALAGIILF